MNGKLRFSKLDSRAVLPSRGSEFSAGLDLYSIEDITIPSRKHAAVRTGLTVALPKGCYGRVAPRSGLAVSKGIDTLAGVIDSDYRGEIICVLINHGDSNYFISTGDRIAQLIVESIFYLEPQWSKSLDDTDRGATGFGSTGIS